MAHKVGLKKARGLHVARLDPMHTSTSGMFDSLTRIGVETLAMGEVSYANSTRSMPNIEKSSVSMPGGNYHRRGALKLFYFFDHFSLCTKGISSSSSSL